MENYKDKLQHTYSLLGVVIVFLKSVSMQHCLCNNNSLHEAARLLWQQCIIILGFSLILFEQNSGRSKVYLMFV